VAGRGSAVICVIHAHPYPGRSRLNRAFTEALRTAADVDLRELYDLYPDFDVDVEAEQRALARAELVVWMHPLYWYSVPALLKHWLDKVLALGWAYGEGGTKLAGKSCLWVPTTGGDERDFTAAGVHRRPFAHFELPIEQTARYCGMVWETPLVVYGADAMEAAQVDDAITALQRRLAAWRDARARTTVRASP